MTWGVRSPWKLSGWWFQPIWKILVKLVIFPNFRDENKTYLSCHHPVVHGIPFSPWKIIRKPKLKTLEGTPCHWRDLGLIPSQVEGHPALVLRVLPLVLALLEVSIASPWRIQCTHRIHGDERYIYLHEWLVVFNAKLVRVGEYTIPMDLMDPMGMVFDIDIFWLKFHIVLLYWIII